MAAPQKSLYRDGPQRGHQTLRGKVLVTQARAVPVLGLFGDGMGTVWGTGWGMVSLVIHDNTPAYRGILYLGCMAGG